MGGILAVAYGVVAYAFFLITFTYAIGFVGELVVPKTINSGVPGSPLLAVAVNAALLGVFAVQHSVMARPAFKRWWTSFVPKSVERSTYVLASSLALALLYWQWRPLPATLWDITNPVFAYALWALFFAGWGAVVLSTFLISHFELFGISQTLAKMADRAAPEQKLVQPLFYKWVRHPLYLGFIVAFWAIPHMTVGHLLFAVGATGYIFVGIFFEERDMIASFGDEYRRYREKVGMILPKFGR